MQEEQNQNRLFSSDLRYDDLLKYIGEIPALLWRIETVKNRIEYINSYELPGLEDRSTLLLKNMSFSKEVILKDDFSSFEAFMKSARDRRASISIFRIKLADGTIRWLKISGWPDTHRSSYYMGYILEITDEVFSIRALDTGHLGIQEEIALFDNPVLLVSFSDKRIIAGNTAATQLLGYSSEEMKLLSMENLFENNLLLYSNNIYEEIIFHRRWNGELSFHDRTLQSFSCDVAMRPLYEGGKNFLWVSLYNITKRGPYILTNEQPLSGPRSDLMPLLGKMKDAAAAGQMLEMLNILLLNQPDNDLADSILYSDIHIDEGRVITYGTGPSFLNLEPGKEYPYEGTIAENIIKYGLDNIIVDDTFQSIKPIDWALFIPCSVRSYYAEPYFENGILRTVLIFCSSAKGVFNEKNSRPYSNLYPLFYEGLKVWRNSIKTGQ